MSRDDALRERIRTLDAALRVARQERATNTRLELESRARGSEDVVFRLLALRRASVRKLRSKETP